MIILHLKIQRFVGQKYGYFVIAANLFQLVEQRRPFMPVCVKFIVLYHHTVERELGGRLLQFVLVLHDNESFAPHLDERPVLRIAVKTEHLGVVTNAKRIQQPVGILVIVVRE